MPARSPFWKAASAFALIISSLALAALSFGPCGGGYFTLVPGALLFIWGVGKIIALLAASLNI